MMVSVCISMGGVKVVWGQALCNQILEDYTSKSWDL